MGRKRLLTLVLTTVAAGGCGSGPSDELTRLEARVDSLATVVAALRAPRGNAAPVVATISNIAEVSVGSPSAPVTIVEFTDFQCPFCARHASETLPVLRRDFIERGSVRYVVRDNPMPFHEHARFAAAAARCVAAEAPEQYWEYHDALFVGQASLSDSMVLAIAADVGAPAARIAACAARPDILGLVDRDAAEARNAGMAGTPSFIIARTSDSDSLRGTVIVGAYPVSAFVTVIDSLLALDGNRSATPTRRTS